MARWMCLAMVGLVLLSTTAFAEKDVEVRTLPAR